MANYLGFEPTKRNNDYYFVSYSSADAGYVGAVCGQLNKHKIPLWYDYGIQYGNEWEVSITKRIAQCTAVILFFSPRILENKNSYVLKELEIAKDYEKPVYTIHLKAVNIKTVPAETHHYWVDIRRYQGIEAFKLDRQTVLQELERALQNTPVNLEADSDSTVKNTDSVKDKLALQKQADEEFERVLRQMEDDAAAEKELENIRRDILKILKDPILVRNTELLAKADEYYQKCTEFYGTSDMLTSYAYELKAYMTYANWRYREAIPLLKTIYQKKKNDSGNLHPETIEVLYMLADAQSKGSILPSSKYRKEFIKHAEEFLDGDEPHLEQVLEKYESIGLYKRWSSPVPRLKLFSDGTGTTERLMNLCDIKRILSCIGEDVLNSKRPPCRSDRDLKTVLFEERSQDEIVNEESGLYVTDLLYGPLSEQSMSELSSLGRMFWYNNKTVKSIYYYRECLERSIQRDHQGIANGGADTHYYARKLYKCYELLGLEKCPQAREVYRIYQESSRSSRE